MRLKRGFLLPGLLLLWLLSFALYFGCVSQPGRPSDLVLDALAANSATGLLSIAVSVPLVEALPKIDVEVKRPRGKHGVGMCFAGPGI